MKIGFPKIEDLIGKKYLIAANNKTLFLFVVGSKSYCFFYSGKHLINSKLPVLGQKEAEPEGERILAYIDEKA